MLAERWTLAERKHLASIYLSGSMLGHLSQDQTRHILHMPGVQADQGTLRQLWDPSLESTLITFDVLKLRRAVMLTEKSSQMKKWVSLKQGKVGKRKLETSEKERDGQSKSMEMRVRYARTEDGIHRHILRTADWTKIKIEVLPRLMESLIINF